MSGRAVPTADSSSKWWERNWKWFVPALLLLLVAAIAAFAGLAISIVLISIRSSDVYQEALSRARSNPAVIEKLGEPIREGVWTTGSIQIQGSSGSADLDVHISGPKGKAEIVVIAEKRRGKWNYSTMEVDIETQTEAVDLLHPGEAVPSSSH